MAFEKIKNLVRYFEQTKGGELVVRIIEENDTLQVDILEMNRFDQLFQQGIDSKGDLIGVYSYTTELLSGGLKKAGDHYTLEDTGHFFESFKIMTGKDFFEIIANPIKPDANLFDKYGADIVGLTEESKKKLQMLMIPLIQKHIRNKISRL
jgi:hypothetical protein